MAAPGDLSFEHLGTGGRSDRLGFGVILRLLLRCAQLLRPVRAHLIRLFLGFSALAIAFLPLGILLFDAFFTRVLQGEPLLPLEATFLGLDPAVFVDVDALDPDSRRALLRRIIWVGVASGVVISPLIMLRPVTMEPFDLCHATRCRSGTRRCRCRSLQPDCLSVTNVARVCRWGLSMLGGSAAAGVVGRF